MSVKQRLVLTCLQESCIMLSGWHLHPVSIRPRDQRPLHPHGVCQGQPWRQPQQPTRELSPGTDQKNNHLWEMWVAFYEQSYKAKANSEKTIWARKVLARTRFTSCSCRRRIWRKHQLCKWGFTSRVECELAERSVHTSFVVLKLWYYEEVGSLKEFKSQIVSLTSLSSVHRLENVSLKHPERNRLNDVRQIFNLKPVWLFSDKTESFSFMWTVLHLHLVNQISDK